jgi:ABC-type glycerol-3-phosphate transport system permease component
LSRFKVARLLDEARATGIVRIELDSPGHIDLHPSLTARGTIVIPPMIVVGLIVRTWLVTGLTLGAVTEE